jgi:hypothetical protein
MRVLIVQALLTASDTVCLSMLLPGRRSARGHSHRQFVLQQVITNIAVWVSCTAAKLCRLFQERCTGLLLVHMCLHLQVIDLNVCITNGLATLCLASASVQVTIGPVQHQQRQQQQQQQLLVLPTARSTAGAQITAAPATQQHVNCKMQ